MRGEGGSDDAWAVSAVLGAVRSIEFIVEVVITLLERDILLQAGGPDAAFVANLRPAEPGRAGPVHRADVEVVTVADDSDRDRPAQRAVPSARRDPKLVRCGDPRELITRPRGHRCISFREG